MSDLQVVHTQRSPGAPTLCRVERGPLSRNATLTNCPECLALLLAERAAPDLLLLVEQLLEHAEQPLDAEEWFALRDAARAVLAGAKGGGR